MDRTTTYTRYTYAKKAARIPQLSAKTVLRAAWLVSLAVFSASFLLTVFTGFYPFLVASGISGLFVIVLGLMSEYYPAERLGVEKKIIKEAEKRFGKFGE